VLKTIPKNETEKIKNVLLKIVTIFSIFGMCFSMLQASLSGPFVRLFLEDKWLQTIEIVQILSIGIGFNVASTVWAVAFRLNDNFKTMAKYSFFSVFVFLILVILFTLKLEIIGTAIGVCLFNILVNFILMVLSLGEYDIKVKTLLSITLKYFLLAFAIFYSLFYISNIYNFSDIVKILTNGLLPVFLYFTSLYFFDKKSKDILLFIINKYIRKQ
jgi:O-antigen/teichoic acid export membrane protein